MTRRHTDPAELQSDALGRWLDRAAPVSPPEEIDREVVEAIYALRPDLAPAPRVTAEDILASLTAGPLADPSAAAHAAPGHHEAEVVPFPARGRAERDTAEGAEPEADVGGPRAGRVWRWFGGTGGVGMALVAAATLVLVVTPVLRSRQEVPQTTASPASAEQAATERVSAAAPPADAFEQVTAAPASPAESKNGAATGVAANVPADPSVIPMADAPALGPSTLIPELSEPRVEVASKLVAEDAEDDAVASVDAEPVPAEVQAPAAASRPEPAQKASQDEAAQAGWSSGASGRAVSRAEQAVARADAQRAAGDRAGAARTLEAAASGAPARVAQHLLGLAAQDWLGAGDPAAARAAAERGLVLSAEDTPERRRLQAVLAGL